VECNVVAMLKRAVTTAIINLLVLCALLGGIEAFYRFVKKGPFDSTSHEGIQLNLFPYVMIVGDRYKYVQWINDFTGKLVPTTIESNSLGFNDHHEFKMLETYKKANNERVVVLTGASEAWGLGATSTENAIAGRTEYYLNSRQHDRKYTVVNMAGPSWISYQEFVALELWGEEFNPDWVIVMDGLADASVGCAISQGLMNPLYFPAMKDFLKAYFGAQHPVYYRGWLENQIIKYSVAYRTITRQDYIPYNFVFDQGKKTNTRDSIQQVIVPTKIGEAREMLAFYLKAEQAMLKLYPRAKYILSTAPVVNQFSGDFTDVYDHMDDPELHAAAAAKRAHDLDVYLDAHDGENCNTESYNPALTYVFVKGAIELEDLVNRERSDGRAVEYYNIGRLFPDDRAERIPYFINPSHLSDKGADAIGKFYSDRILAADSGGAPAQQ
jgi:hypothetical protein